MIPFLVPFILQRGDWPVLSILHLILLVHIDCSRVLHIKASMHPFKSLFLIHLHVLSLSLSLSLANCPSTIFQSTNFLFILLQFFFNSLRSIVSLYALVLFVLTATGIGSILFLTQAIYFTLQTVFTFNKSSSIIFPRNIQLCIIISWRQFFIHCHIFPGLSVHFLQFIIPLKYSSPTPHNGDGQSVQRHYLIPSIQFNLQNQFCPTEISFLNSSFISCSFIVILQHPQVFISIFFCLSIFSPLGNSISSVDLTFTLFIIITPLFNTKKYAYALTKDLYSRNRPFDFIFLFPYSIKSSINRRWLIFSTPLPNVYLASALHSS